MRRLYPLAYFLGILAFTNVNLLAQDSKTLQPRPQVSYPLGVDSKIEGDLKGKLEGPFLFKSDIIKETVRKYWVYVPPQYKADEPAAVLVFQDGARATNPNGVLRVQNVLENLIEKKQIPVTIGIFITPGQRGDEFPDDIGTGNPNNRDREYDVLDDTYARFIVDEMLPEVGKKYNLSKDPAARAIGGSSSGAICAFTVAWHRPDQFRNVISMIGSFTDIHGGHVYPDLILESDPKPIRIFLQDGVNDNRSPQNTDRDWYLQNQKMKAALDKKGYDMAFVLGEGGHSDDHGGAMLPQMLRWVWRDYPGVVSPENDTVAEAAAIEPQVQDPFPNFDATAKTDPTGVWTWERRGGNNSSVSTLTIQGSEPNYSGSISTQRGDDAPTVSEISNVMLEGNKLSFETVTRFRDTEMPTTMAGVIEGDSIRGWSMTSFGGNQRDNRWQAERKSEQPDFTGEWIFKVARRDGSTSESTLTLQKEGESYKGTYNSQFFGENPVKNVTVKSNVLEFDVEFERDGNPMTFAYSLRKNGESYEGVITSDFGGQTNETAFEVERK